MTTCSKCGKKSPGLMSSRDPRGERTYPQQSNSSTYYSTEKEPTQSSTYYSTEKEPTQSSTYTDQVQKIRIHTNPQQIQQTQPDVQPDPAQHFVEQDVVDPRFDREYKPVQFGEIAPTAESVSTSRVATGAVVGGLLGLTASILFGGKAGSIVASTVGGTIAGSLLGAAVTTETKKA